MGQRGHPPARPGARPGAGIRLAVFRTHLSGQPLNDQARAGRLLGPVRTAPAYRLHALATSPRPPGLVRVASRGAPVTSELWELPAAQVGPFLGALPAPMTPGMVRLDDGHDVTGSLC